MMLYDHATETGISSGLVGHLARMQTLPTNMIRIRVSFGDVYIFILVFYVLGAFLTIR